MSKSAWCQGPLSTGCDFRFCVFSRSTTIFLLRLNEGQPTTALYNLAPWPLLLCHVTGPNSRTHVLSLWVLFSICMQTSYVSMPDFLQSSDQAVGQWLSHLCYGTLGVPRRCCVAARDSEDVDSACQSLGPILLLLLSRFSCVRLCATP